MEAILWLVNAFWFLLMCVYQLLGERSANVAPKASGICLFICFFFQIFPQFCVKRDKRLCLTLRESVRRQSVPSPSSPSKGCDISCNQTVQALSFNTALEIPKISKNCVESASGSDNSGFGMTRWHKYPPRFGRKISEAVNFNRVARFNEPQIAFLIGIWQPISFLLGV